MKKVKYYFNKHTLSYEKVNIGLRQRFLQIFGFFCATLVFAAIIVFLAFQFLNSPKEKMLVREIDSMKNHYEELNERLAMYDRVLDELQDRDDNFYRVIFEAEPVANDIRQSGFGGGNRYKDLSGLSEEELMRDIERRIDRVEKEIYVQSQSYDEIADMIKNREDMYASLPAIQPVSNKDLKRLASGFGMRIHPIYKTRKMHKGVDFTAPTGTEIYSTGAGTVVYAANTHSGYGKKVVIDHGYSYKTLYAHLHEIKVKKGQKVSRGELIGTVGSTGLSTAPHLHYEVHKNGRAINPTSFFYNDLTPEEYELLVELSTKANQSFD